MCVSILLYKENKFSYLRKNKTMIETLGSNSKGQSEGNEN